MRNNTSSTTGAAAGDVRLREPRGASPEMRRGGVAGAGPRRRCAAGLELGLTGDVPRGPLLELRGAASRGGSHRRCAVLRAAGDLAGDAPRARGRRSWGDFLFFLAPDPTAARLASSGYGWTGRKFQPVRRRLVVPKILSVSRKK
ncbi:hypothetical protein VPH35_009401 [Triticum aestivum]